MARENYFDILKLASDAKDATIAEAIANEEKRIQGQQGQGGTRQEEKDRLNAYIREMKAWAADKEAVKAEREAFIAKQSDAVRAYFSSLPNKKEVYKREVDSWVKRYRLARPIIEKLMAENPEHTVILVKLQGLPKGFLDLGFKGYLAAVQKLNASADLAKDFLWAPKVKDFYDFVAFMGGENPDAIRKADTAYISGIVNKYKNEVRDRSGGNSGDRGLPIRDILAGLGNVFDPTHPEARNAYDNSVKYERLRPYFDQIKQNPEEIRKEDHFAQHYLELIKREFDSDEIALAIYNLEAGLANDPYEPSKVVVSMRCGNCGAITNFSTHEEAKHGKCSVCGSAFYIQCPSCGQSIPATSTTCGHCGFNLGEFTKVESYVNSAKSAFARGDLAEANLYLEQALSADPKKLKLSKMADFAGLQAKISAEYEKFRKYLTGLTGLISAKKFMAAVKEADNVKKAAPNLDLGPQLKQINEAIAKAKSLMPSPSDTSEAAADRCYATLEEVSDYLPAIEHLHKIPLAMIQNFRVVPLGGDKFGASVTFAPSINHRVSYYLTRNADHMPKTYSDGTPLLKGSPATNYEDFDVEPGRVYYYAVFASREGVFSPAATAQFASYGEVERLEAIPQGQKCSISFSLALNSIGVRITRKENAIPSPGDPSAITIEKETRTAIDDTSVQLDHQYGYLLESCYLVNNQRVYSRGKGILVKIERDPSDLENVVITKKDEAIQVSYRSVDPTSPNPVRLYAMPISRISNRMHALYPIEEANAYLNDAKLLGASRANAGSFVLSIPGNYSYEVVLVSMTDTKARFCGTGKVSSIEMPQIDTKATTIKDGSRCYARLKRTPENLFGLHYIVLDANHSKNEITQADIGGHLSNFISATDYRREGLMDLRGRPIMTGRFKLLLVGEYVINGVHAFSDTVVTMISASGPQSVGYKIEWTKKGLFKKTVSAELVIEGKDPLPDLGLYGRNGSAPLSPSDFNADEIIRIDASTPSTPAPGGLRKYTLPESMLVPGTVYRLFVLSEADVKITAKDYNSLTYPK